MSSIDSNLIYQPRRADNATKIKRQAAANALQQYSLLALQAVKDGESPAKTRLKMMRALTDLPNELPKESYGSMRKKSTGPSSR
ncbi:hypothetical protein V8B55DRAFT_1431171 [Mucor lusitanicus]|uniref:Uncharacterized protein n=2 Tax=Mucor TaxID=4830 RepID=A0A162YYJ7_MUCCL|nr:hypothetical protein MUCCIDRAFT_112861 [Mucor lusitanicus CBS 277.49]